MPGRPGDAVSVLALALVTVLAGCGLGLPTTGPSETTDSSTPSPDPAPTSPAASSTPTPSTTPASAPTSPTSSASSSPSGAPARTATPSEPAPRGLGTSRGANGTTVPGSRPNGTDGLAVRGGTLPYDATRTYDRVQRLLGTDVDPPVVWIIEDARGSGGEGLVTVGPDADEVVLAHEYAHYVLYEEFGPYERGDPDATWARWASAEGAAQYVERAYARRYLDEPPRVIRLPPDPGLAYEAAMYRFGARYYEARTSDPGGVTDLYPYPPNTSEQVIHGLAPAAEPPAPLRATATGTTAANESGSSATRAAEEQGRLGEITVFVTLRIRLGAERAFRAASGWGNDRLLAFRDGNATAYAWVIRWDDADAETAFRESVADFRTSSVDAGGTPTASRRTPHRGFTDLAWTRSNATIAYRQVSDETGVVLVGPDRFVERARVSGATANVTVGVER